MLQSVESSTGLAEFDDLQALRVRRAVAARRNKAPTRMLTTGFEDVRSQFLVVWPRSTFRRQEFPRLNSSKEVLVKPFPVLAVPKPDPSARMEPNYERLISFLGTLAYSASGTPPKQ